ncbi:HD domain-containing protein [Propylenella binzhouense]|uniref:HD domain-containing protein n=1 Tax=Propylenella binzhouense TaxID=2555902 RepID=A0A964WTD3_9HYPH|nr:HD domain-containing protein [Propylenella binzhouense]MYZ47841.1 HD domain-containing protein [Propylenella binzhouense]
MSDEILKIVRAVAFAAERHGLQKRKGERGLPYFTHLAEVAALVAAAGPEAIPAAELPAADLLAAAYLHDVVEDGHATAGEVETLFGRNVAALVGELTDDATLPDEVRRERQVDHIAGASRAARLLKLADKTSNIHGIAEDPPADWPPAKLRAYVEWGVRVVDAGCRGIAPELEHRFDAAVREALARAGD